MKRKYAQVVRAGMWLMLGAAGSVWAQTPGQKALQKMDTDGDGRLSYEEISVGYHANQDRMKEGFKKRDANGNGLIEKGEIPLLRFNRLDLDQNGSIPVEEFLVANSSRARDFVAKTDSNKDGYVTMEELGRGVKQAAADADASYQEIAASYYESPTRRKRLYRMLDADSSDGLQPGEWPDPGTFAAMDADRDGQISEKEFMNAHAHVTSALVRATDLNRDGRISLTELRQVRAKAGDR